MPLQMPLRTGMDESSYAMRDGRTEVMCIAEVLYKILVILSVGGLASGLRAWLFNSAAERVMARLRFRLFSHLMGQEMGFFDRVRTGELMNRLSELIDATTSRRLCALPSKVE